MSPVLILAHSIGTDHSLWAQQIEDLLPHFHVLRYDIRGHGASDTPSGDYSVEELGRETIGLADFLGIDKFYFCGISLGGAIGEWLASNVPDRVIKLVLASTSPRFGPPGHWEERRKTVLEQGMSAIVDTSMTRSFSPEILAAEFHVFAIRAMMVGTNPVGYAGCCAALRDFDGTQMLSKITAPTLVIVGDADVSTPAKGNGEVLARDIPQARLLTLSAAHLSNVERPRSFTAALFDFLLPSDNLVDPVTAGFEVRREVLGDEHVEKAIEATTEFTREFQELITKYAWGTIWTRPGLDHRTRRLLTLAIAASLGRWEEFTLHVRSGLVGGLEACDLKEVLLQVAIYAGAPGANTAFHIAGEILNTTPKDRPSVQK